MGTLWRDEYRTGIDQIDDQHRLLFDKIEKLLDIARSNDGGSSQRDVMEILRFLIEYTEFHFETEEGFQRDRAYRSYAEHVKIHREFKETILAYQELLSRNYTAKTLRNFIGMLITWLVNHVCLCDRKIIKNIPIIEMESFSDTESCIKNVAQRLLTGTYDIPIRNERSYIYMGRVEGELIIRTVIRGSGDHLIIYGLPGRIAKMLYQKMSGMDLADLNAMDEVETSAFVEIGNIISSYAMNSVEDFGKTRIQFQGDIHIREYQETEYQVSNSVVLEFATDFGKVNILYSPIKERNGGSK